MNATYDLMEGDEGAYSRINKIHVSGTIVPLEGDSKRYYQEYVDDLGWTREEEELFLPYILKVGYKWNLPLSRNLRIWSREPIT